MSDQLEQFAGTIVRRGEATYDLHCYQYAYSSHGTDGHMQPAAVLYPTSSRDVALALAYAARQSLRVAVRSGGHHLLGASSTSGAGLLMDLRDTYRAFEWDAARNLLRVGVSHSLDSFNAQLGALGLFLPHGQCSHVRLGGHVQTNN
jgi:FAD/FMN-containing dehydrogenase